MNYPAGAQNDSRAPWNEVPAKENDFKIDGFVSSHDGNDVHAVKIKGSYIQTQDRKVITCLVYSYPEGNPVKAPADPEYEVREAVRAELGRITFNCYPEIYK